jgi:DNA-binding response OmpR family regulator
MEPTRSILLAEEDHVVRTFLADNLTADGFAVTIARNKSDALERLYAQQPDLVLCDVNGKTLELVDAVRQAPGLAAAIDPDVPLIILTARSDDLARVRYFEHGCDDVVAKPFCYPELLARIRAVLRRSYDRPSSETLRVGALRIDVPARTVHLDGIPVELAGKEYALLVHLASGPHACSPSRNCYARSGATAPTAPRGRWTRTPSGCAATSPPPTTTPGYRTSGASATG